MQEWGDIRAAVIPMFHRLKQIKGGNGTGRPEITNDHIVFNGDGSKGEAHESFVLSRVSNFEGERVFQFCKTARKPYDRYVKAVLIVAQRVAPGALEVSCDGDDEPDCWTEGQRIADIYMGKSVINGFPEVAKVDTKRDKIDTGINKIAKLAEWMDDTTIVFLANYLKANIDDIKDAYQPT
jgi:hypothetical protein